MRTDPEGTGPLEESDEKLLVGSAARAERFSLFYRRLAARHYSDDRTYPAEREPWGAAAMRTRHPTIVIASVPALALAAGLVLAASACATFPGRNGLIAFTARVAGPEQRFGSEQVFVMNPDGSGEKQITHGTRHVFPGV